MGKGVLRTRQQFMFVGLRKTPRGERAFEDREEVHRRGAGQGWAQRPAQASFVCQLGHVPRLQQWAEFILLQPHFNLLFAACYSHPRLGLYLSSHY